MIIFGGFTDGARTNEILKYSFNDNMWIKVDKNISVLQPTGRSGHSAVIFNNNMYIFGGKDEDNNKLNDLWKLDLATFLWTELKTTDGSEPLPRSGHSCEVYEGYMLMFGGIYEITKELNDFCMYDFRKNRWITLFEESVSPKKIPADYSVIEDSSPVGGKSPKRGSLSPLTKKSTTKAILPTKTSSKSVTKHSRSPVKKNLNVSVANGITRNSK
jgi:N-acetylneuraminic acid mutarotase